MFMMNRLQKQELAHIHDEVINIFKSNSSFFSFFCIGRSKYNKTLNNRIILELNNMIHSGYKIRKAEKYDYLIDLIKNFIGGSFCEEINNIEKYNKIIITKLCDYDEKFFKDCETRFIFSTKKDNNKKIYVYDESVEKKSTKVYKRKIDITKNFIKVEKNQKIIFDKKYKNDFIYTLF